MGFTWHDPGSTATLARRRALLLVGLIAVVGGVAMGSPGEWSSPRWTRAVSIGRQTAAEPGITTTEHGGMAVSQEVTANGTPVSHGGTSVPWFVLALCGLALLAVGVLLVRRLRRQRPSEEVARLQFSGATDDVDSTPDAAAVRRGLAQSLVALDGVRVPSDAVVSAWLAMEAAAQQAGVARRPAETPTELTSRILRLIKVDPRSAATLLGLYQRVRFGGHAASSADVELARQCLATMTASWTSPGVASRRSRR